MSDRVSGYCPMGCGATLFLGSGGYVTCSWINCPNPAAVSDLLEDRETEHIATLDGSSFTVKHPLRERIADEILTCALPEYLTSLDGPPRASGTYRVRQMGDAWSFAGTASIHKQQEADNG
jgi:hypothetical protein